MLALGVVLVYFVAAVGVWLGWWAMGWADLTGTKWEPVSGAHWFGTNIIGQDIFDRAIYSTATAFEVGLIVAAGGHRHRRRARAPSPASSPAAWIDELLIWLHGRARRHSLLPVRGGRRLRAG